MNQLAYGRFHVGHPLQQKVLTQKQNVLQEIRPADSIRQRIQPKFGYYSDWPYMMGGGYVVKTPEENAFDAVLNKIRSAEQSFAHLEVQNWLDAQAQKLELASKAPETPLPESFQKQLNQLLARSFEKSNFLVMNQLLKAGADPNGEFELFPMIRWAMDVDSQDGVAALVRYGAKTELPPQEKRPPFQAYLYAWETFNKPMVQLLEHLGASKQGKNPLGRNLLCLLAKHKEIGEMNQLLDEGFSVTDMLPHPEGASKPATILSYVMSWLDPENPMVDRLLKPLSEAGLLQSNGATIWEDIGNLEDEKANAWAIKLISFGLSPNQTLSSDWGTPWQMAAKKGNVPLLKTLIKKEGQTQSLMTQVDGFGRNALMLSVGSGNPEAFLYLKSLGFDISTTTTQGAGLLYEALSNGQLSKMGLDKISHMVETLIQAGVPVNIQDKWGATPLHQAVVLKNLNLVETLLKAGANPLLKTTQDKMAVDLIDRTSTNPYTMVGFSNDALTMFYLLRDATFTWQARENKDKEKQ